MQKHLRYIILLLQIFLFGCGNESCIYTLDEEGNKEGEYKCFFKNGEIRIKGFIRKDSIKVDEEYIYYLNGVLKEYNFYNPKGIRKYNREYDKKGNFIKEQGNYFCYKVIGKPKIPVGDSTYFHVFIANPPGTYFKIYGINASGRYPINMIKKKSNFTQKNILYWEKKGSFRLPLEVEFIDTVNNIREFCKSNLDFNGR